jgi:hypothetical protein
LINAFVRILVQMKSSAQNKPQDWAKVIRGGCESELQSDCGTVTKGEGRILAGLYAREDKLSAKWGGSLMPSIDRLAAAMTSLPSVVRVYDVDPRRLWQGVVVSNGNLIASLTTANDRYLCHATPRSMWRS